MAVSYRDRALLVGDALVVADLHFGKGATSDVELPLGAEAAMIDRLAELLDRFEPAEVVLAGDVVHSFDHVPDEADAAVTDLVRIVREAGARPVAVRGNHDTMLESIWPGEVQDAYELDGSAGLDGGAANAGGAGFDGGTDTGETTVVCHGHEEPDRAADRYVVGHDHPAIVIEGQKRPCWLDGRGVHRGADVLVLPSFNRLVEGVSVNGRLGAARPELSPLVTRVGQFRPVVYDDDADQALEFPPLGQFQRML